MTSTTELKSRNAKFSSNFHAAGMPPLPSMRTVILTCADARVDPAHILGLQLGEAVVIRNTGGRVTPSVIEEIAALAFLANKMDTETPPRFELVIIHHTKCGAERFADPELQKGIAAKLGVDVAHYAITDHTDSLTTDLQSLRNAPEVPSYIQASAYIYDVDHGTLTEVSAPAPLRPS